jgi:hypothetical protein
MSEIEIEYQVKIFLKQFLLMSVLFPLFITVSAVFLYLQGISTSFLLGAVLLLLMGYNLIIARYGLSLWLDLHKDKRNRKRPNDSPA